MFVFVGVCVGVGGCGCVGVYEVECILGRGRACPLDCECASSVVGWGGEVYLARCTEYKVRQSTRSKVRAQGSSNYRAKR